MNDKEKAAYLDCTLSIDERVEDLISRLTLEEKVSQMLHESKEIPRLGIPAYNWWSECLHGVARAGKATVFPQAIGLAAAFDNEMMYCIASAISDEARAKYHAALRKGIKGEHRYRGLTFWSPNVNIFRDPRWGRGQETYGEDPFLSGELGAAFVRGLQGDHPRYLKIAACAKHYAVHSGPEKLRHVFNAICSRKDLYETYLPAFRKLVETGVEAVMGAYNRTNGEVCCGSKTLLQDILRREWNFKGHVLSDCWAIRDFHENHKITDTPEESVALAVQNGCALNCGCVYEESLLQAVEQGLLSEKDINNSLRDLFRARFKLGMFDPDEMVPFSSIPISVINCPEHRQLAREAAEKSFVLLRNHNRVLPLQQEVNRIYVMGPNATNIDALIGNYYGLSDRFVTFLEGIVGRVEEGVSVEYRNACLLDRQNANPADWAVYEAKNYDVVLAFFGLDSSLEGEEGDAIASPDMGDRYDLSLPHNQLEFLKKLKEEVAGTVPIVLILTGGSPIIIPEDLADAIIFAWYPGEEAGNAMADILFGDVNPSGKLPITFPKSLKQLPPYEDYSMAGRTYRYQNDNILFPFGFGLSYTEFTYTNLRISQNSIVAGSGTEVSVDITNSAGPAGTDTVQLYLSSKAEAGKLQPLRQLKGVKKVPLQPGETQTVTFAITPEMLSVVDSNGNTVIEPGTVVITIANACPCQRSLELGASQPVSLELEISPK